MIAVLGSEGQLASSIRKISKNYPNLRINYFPKEKLSFSTEHLHSLLSNYKFKFIINCTAYTNVELAEVQRDYAEKLNANALKALSLVSNNLRARLIHISTDFVFDGSKSTAYGESDDCNPLNWYGKTKLMGESIVKSHSRDFIIIRTSWLYSEFGKNFLKSILLSEENNLKVVDDQIGTPTYSVDLAEAIMQLVENNALTNKHYKMTLHYAGDEQLTWHSFAERINKENIRLTSERYKKSISKISSKELNQKAIRPKFSALKTSSIFNKLGVGPSNLDDGIKHSISEIKASQISDQENL